MIIEEFLTWLVGKAPAFIALAAVTGAVIAVLGYRKWLPENVGKRKIELTEDILADFYRARDVIIWARFPVGNPHEGNTRPANENEAESERSLKNAWFRPIERLNNEGKLFSSIQAKKYRAMAYFGTDAGQPFQDLKAIHTKIVVSAGMLISTYQADENAPPGRGAWEEAIGVSVEPDSQDKIAKEVDELIERVESLFGQWLMRGRVKTPKKS